MSNQEPKPGELWLVRHSRGGEVPGFVDAAGEWYDLTSRWLGDTPTPLRRLIVLDPKSADDVKRMQVAFVEVTGSRMVSEGEMFGVFRNVAAPPEPEMPEPTALGTVVVDGNGETWVSAQYSGAIRPWVNTSNARRRSWEEIPRPVRLATDEERGA